MIGSSVIKKSKEQTHIQTEIPSFIVIIFNSSISVSICDADFLGPLRHENSLN